MLFLLALEPILDLALGLTCIGLFPMITKVGVPGDFVNRRAMKNKIIFCEGWIVKVSWQNESELPHLIRQVLHRSKKQIFVKLWREIQ